MDDVEQRLVDLPHIVEQCHALDVALLERIQIRRVGEDQCITSDAPDVAAGFSIVGVDGAKQCLENGGRESFGGQPALSFAREEDSACRSQCEPEVTNHGSRGRKKRATRVGWPVSKRCRRWPTLPRPLGRSTIGAVGLNDRVRDGNGCGPYALIASDFFVRRLRLRVHNHSMGGDRMEKKREEIDRVIASSSRCFTQYCVLCG